MMTNPTGSGLDRIARCEASASLPQAIDASEDDKDREAGSVRHKFLERVPVVGREEALGEVDPKHRAMCEDIQLAKLGDRLKLSTEVALAYNWKADTARILTPVAPRVYDIDSTCEVAGTIDLAGVGNDRSFAGDYKGAHGWLPHPSASRQLGLAALSLARIYEKDMAEVEYIRLLNDGDSIPFRSTLDGFALDGIAAEIRNVMERIPEQRARVEAGIVPSVVEGGWCRRCPARHACPAKVAMVRAVISDPPMPYSTGITPENAREAYLMLRKAKDAIKIFEAGMFAYAKLERIPIETQSDGSVLYFGEFSRPGNDVVDGAIAHRVLSARYGGEAANKAVTMEITKTAIKDVIRPALRPDEKITKVFDEVIGEIDAAGGISKPTTTTTTEYALSPDGAAKAKKRNAVP